MSVISIARNITIEIEALLTLADSLGDNDPKTCQVINLVKDKIAELSETLEMNQKPVESDLPSPQSDDITQSEETESSYLVDHEGDGHEDSIEDLNVATGDIENIESEDVASNEEDELLENAASEEIESNLASGVDTLELPRPDESPIDNQPDEEPQEIVTKPIPASEKVNDTVTEVSVANNPGNERVDLATDVNERTFINNARDLTKVFTLNDKFRFRRELFGNSNAEFTRALDLISVMHHPEEAEDYFYTDLGWNPENDDVKDFMRIIRSYMLNKQSKN